MKFKLPDNHGLPKEIAECNFLIHRSDKGCPSLTDAQYCSIESGIGSGASLLLVAPTSSGKTEVGLIAAATWLLSGDGMSRKVIYLVSHKALARQKFNELRQENYLSIFGIDHEDLAISTGDRTVNGNNTPITNPLDSTFLIATYEKFLAISAGLGRQRDMRHCCIIADEMQIVTDQNRGRDIEILLTFIRQACPGQFIGLSAVLTMRDANILADWMNIESLYMNTREVPIKFKLATPNQTYNWQTDQGEKAPNAVEKERWPNNTLDIVEKALTELKAGPVAVFCMRKSRVEELAEGWIKRHDESISEPQILELPFDEETELSNQLALLISLKAGLHSADLVETERHIVEEHLDEDELSVVFATTTLAQGLNYSFRTVIFDEWSRWKQDRGQYEPISRGEFHNMSGRSGRLGITNEGLVVFRSGSNKETRAALNFLTLDMEDQVKGRIDPRFFEQVSLQILASGLAQDMEGIKQILIESLSAHVAGKYTNELPEFWSDCLERSVHNLKESGFVV